jgi:elongation factor P
MGVSDLGRGQVIEWEGELYLIEEYSHMKKAQRRPVAQTKLRHLKSDRILLHNFTDGEPFKIIRLEERPLQFMYSAGDLFHFMDKETYDQFELSRQQLRGNDYYLRENLELAGLFYEGQFIKIEPPLHVELRVTKTEPGVRGDTVSGAEKPAILESGLEVRVPLFIKEGDLVEIDTRTGQYLSRVGGGHA